MSFPAIQPRVQPVSQNIILPNAKDINYALEFDGTDDYVETEHDDSHLLSSGGTIEVWLKPYSTGQSNYGRIVHKGDDLTGDNGYSFSVAKVEKFLFELNGGSTTFGDDIIDENNYVSVTFDENGDIDCYINGEFIETDSVGDPSGIDSSNPLTIGNLSTSDKNRTFDGIISEVRIWDTVRTQSEIQDNMNKKLNGNETGLVAYYKMNEGSGDTLTDSAGSNDGQIIGATWQEVDY